VKLFGKSVTATAEEGHAGVSHVKTSQPMVDADACRREWPSFVQMMARGLEQKQFADVQGFVRFFNGPEFEGRVLFPALAKLLNIVCVLPVGSATVERSFSHMKIIKTRLRSCLGDDTMEWLMITTIEGPRGDCGEDTRESRPGPRNSPATLRDDQADAIIDRFRDWSGKERYTAL